MTNQEIKENILNTGVNNLKNFGYPQVTNETILTDEVYKAFFKSMLEKNLGYTEQLDEVINELLTQVT